MWSASGSNAVPDLMEQQSLYIQVPVYVVLDWDYTTKQRVLFEALVLSNSSEGTMHVLKLLPYGCLLFCRVQLLSACSC